MDQVLPSCVSIQYPTFAILWWRLSKKRRFWVSRIRQQEWLIIFSSCRRKMIPSRSIRWYNRVRELWRRCTNSYDYHTSKFSTYIDVSIFKLLFRNGIALWIIEYKWITEALKFTLFNFFIIIYLIYNLFHFFIIIYYNFLL